MIPCHGKQSGRLNCRGIAHAGKALCNFFKASKAFGRLCLHVHMLAGNTACAVAYGMNGHFGWEYLPEIKSGQGFLLALPAWDRAHVLARLAGPFGSEACKFKDGVGVASGFVVAHEHPVLERP